MEAPINKPNILYFVTAQICCKSGVKGWTGDPECNFEFNTIKILDNCDVDYRLRIIESIYLKFDKQSLNTQEYSFPLKLF